MNPNSFFFKLTAIFIQYLLLIIIAVPLIYLAFLAQYNFDSGKILFIRILFFSIALALPFVMINAFAFADFKNFDLKYYLKPHQKIEVNIDNKILNEYDEIKSNILKSKKWKLIKQTDNSFLFKKKSILIGDKVSILFKKTDEYHSEIIIESMPLANFIIIDFARNYRNILVVLNALKKH